ncbi:MAG: hypothetical protein JSS72_09545 [Armatimonadetes bacterium]|nr:hypothetical protein [Armatimonadota bacterium]
MSVLPLLLVLMGQTQTPSATPAPQQPVDHKTFSNPRVGFAFDYPSTWQRTKMPKKKRDEAHFQIPTSDPKAMAVLQVTGANYRGEAKTWQQVQVDINRQLRRSITRQWQEEVLGVPLLLTKIEYTQKDVPETAIVALVYTRTNKKLNYRLEAPTAVFPEAEAQFRQTLLSLRTVSGDAPEEEDPGKPAMAPPKPAEKTPTVVALVAPPTKKPSLDSKTYSLAFEQRRLDVLVEKGWQIKNNDGVLQITRPDLGATATIKLLSTIQAGSMQQSLASIANKEIDLFDVVDLRDNSNRNVHGHQILDIWRCGKASSGPLTTFHGVGEAGGDLFWSLELSVPKALGAKQKLQLRKFCDEMVLQPSK